MSGEYQSIFDQIVNDGLLHKDYALNATAGDLLMRIEELTKLTYLAEPMQEKYALNVARKGMEEATIKISEVIEELKESGIGTEEDESS